MATKPGLSALAERAAELERANDTAIASLGPVLRARAKIMASVHVRED